MHEAEIDQPSAPTTNTDSSLRWVWLIILITLAARIAYLLWFSGYELVEDEAQYWLWSKHPSWSYSTKGPGVAWAIWLSTSFFGDAEWAVRLPTVIASAIGALAVGALARDLSADARRRATNDSASGWATPATIGGLSALAYTLAPALQAAGVLMTIDGSYVACWAVAVWAFWKALSTRSKPQVAHHDPYRGWHWALVGLALGVGFLFKYTILLLVPGLIAFALLQSRRKKEYESPDERRFFGAPSERWWFTAGVALALLGLVPVIVWNAQHGWPTVAHLIGHLGLPGGDMPIAPDAKREWSPVWLPELIGQQILMIGPWLIFAAIVCIGMRSDGRDDPRRTGRRYLICCAAPILIFYAIVALIAEPEGNWPMAAYVTLLPLVAWAAADALVLRRAARAAGDHTLPTPPRSRVLLWNIGLWYAIVAAIPVHFPDRIGDAAIVLNRQPWFQSAFQKITGRMPRDPAGRVRGGKAIALHVGELLHALEERTDKTGFVLCQHYGRASQIAYYIPARFTRPEKGTQAGSYSARRKEKPLVLCAMHETGGRKTQFDYWPHTSLYQIGIMGHPAVVVGSTRPEVTIAFQRMFDRFEELPNNERLRGENKPDRNAYLGIGYKGPEEHLRAVREAQEQAGKQNAPREEKP